jgi:hypothetical protein
VKSILVVVALAGFAWWLQRQIAVSRRDEPTTLDLLKAAIKRNAA